MLFWVLSKCLKHCQAWDIHRLSGKPVTEFDQPLGNVLTSSLNLSLASLCHFHQIPGTQPSASLCFPSSESGRERWHYLPALYGLDNPIALNLFPQDMPSSPGSSFVVLLWMFLRILTSFLDCGAKNCKQHQGEAAPVLRLSCYLYPRLSQTRWGAWYFPLLNFTPLMTVVHSLQPFELFYRDSSSLSVVWTCLSHRSTAPKALLEI